jgi:HSP20 family protein
MRFVPTRRDDLFDDMFDDVFNAPVFNMPGDGGLMKTDIAEKDGKYNLTVDMPGFRKEDIKVSLFKGNLTVSASHNENKDQKDEKGNVIRQERYSGSCSRTFYVGDNVKEEDITAAYTNGVLELSFPSAVKKAEEEKKFIDIK